MTDLAAGPALRVFRVRCFDMLDPRQRGTIAKEVRRQFLERPPTGGAFNFRLANDQALLSGIYRRFVDISAELLGPFELDPRNSDSCWAYCSYEGSRPDAVHSHERTAHINGVYYLSLPRPQGRDEGGLTVFGGGGEELQILPEEGDLLLFDGRLRHLPGRIATTAWRISINMEILVRNHAEVQERFGTACPGGPVERITARKWARPDPR